MAQSKQTLHKLSFTSLGRAKYSLACAAIYYWEQLYQVMDYYEQPRLEALRIDFKSEGSLSHTQYLQLMRFYHGYRSKVVEAIGEDKYNLLMLEEQELASEKERMEQQAASEKDGNASITYED